MLNTHRFIHRLSKDQCTHLTPMRVMILYPTSDFNWWGWWHPATYPYIIKCPFGPCFDTLYLYSMQHTYSLPRIQLYGLCMPLRGMPRSALLELDETHTVVWPLHILNTNSIDDSLLYQWWKFMRLMILCNKHLHNHMPLRARPDKLRLHSI